MATWLVPGMIAATVKFALLPAEPSGTVTATRTWNCCPLSGTGMPSAVATSCVMAMCSRRAMVSAGAVARVTIVTRAIVARAMMTAASERGELWVGEPAAFSCSIPGDRRQEDRLAHGYVRQRKTRHGVFDQRRRRSRAGVCDDRRPGRAIAKMNRPGTSIHEPDILTLEIRLL